MAFEKFLQGKGIIRDRPGCPEAIKEIDEKAIKIADKLEFIAKVFREYPFAYRGVWGATSSDEELNEVKLEYIIDQVYSLCKDIIKATKEFFE